VFFRKNYTKKTYKLKENSNCLVRLFLGENNPAGVTQLYPNKIRSKDAKRSFYGKKLRAPK